MLSLRVHYFKHSIFPARTESSESELLRMSENAFGSS